MVVIILALLGHFKMTNNYTYKVIGAIVMGLLGVLTKIGFDIYTKIKARNKELFDKDFSDFNYVYDLKTGLSNEKINDIFLLIEQIEATPNNFKCKARKSFEKLKSLSVILNEKYFNAYYTQFYSNVCQVTLESDLLDFNVMYSKFYKTVFNEEIDRKAHFNKKINSTN